MGACPDEDDATLYGQPLATHAGGAPHCAILRLGAARARLAALELPGRDLNPRSARSSTTTSIRDRPLTIPGSPLSSVPSWTAFSGDALPLFLLRRPRKNPNPEPEPLFADGTPVEFQIALPAGTKVAKEAAERLLMSFTYASRPIGFEVVGVKDAIITQFACADNDRAQLVATALGPFPGVIHHGARRDSSRNAGTIGSHPS